MVLGAIGSLESLSAALAALRISILRALASPLSSSCATIAWIVAPGLAAICAAGFG